jgi:hypothetical protein
MSRKNFFKTLLPFPYQCQFFVEILACQFSW